MEAFFQYGVPLGIIASAGLLIAWHRRTWRAAESAPLDEKERVYRERQYRRRMQTAVMLGLVGLVMLAGNWIAQPGVDVVFAIGYWVVLLVLLGWILLLTLIDYTSTRLHFGRLQRNYQIEELRLRSELARLLDAEKKSEEKRGRS